MATKKRKRELPSAGTSASVKFVTGTTLRLELDGIGVVDFVVKSPTRRDRTVSAYSVTPLIPNVQGKIHLRLNHWIDTPDFSFEIRNNGVGTEIDVLSYSAVHSA